MRKLVAAAFVTMIFEAVCPSAGWGGDCPDNVGNKGRPTCGDGGITKHYVFRDPPSKPGQPENWYRHTWTSKVDDRRIEHIYTSAREPIRTGFRTVQPILFVRCREGAAPAGGVTEVYIATDVFLAMDWTTVMWRIDRDKAITGNYAVSTDHKAFFLGAGRAAINIVRNWFGRSRLVFQIRPHGEARAEFEFDIRGLEQAVKPVADLCGWRVVG